MNKKNGFAEVNGTRLYYEMAGLGDTLVFIHDFGADCRTWDAQFDALAADYQVVRYDMRGFGRSAVPTEAPYAHADDLKALLDSLAIARACVIGQSMGGGVAIDFALAYPEVVRALVLVDAALDGYTFSEWEETWGAVFGIAATQGTQASLAFMIGLPAFETLRANPALESRLMQIWSDYSGWHFAHRDPVQSADPPAIHQLEQIHVPTLVIVGEHDFADHHAIADILRQRIPDARKVVLPDVGHVSMMEAPDRFNEILSDFLVGS
jgi:pimeloyl-ACP methyl ester carboxylesterase